MFQDLDNTLRAILDDQTMSASIAELRNADKIFLTPDRNFAPGPATVNMFLYDVKENRHLRDPEPIVEKIGTTFAQRPPPLRVDCCYLVTTWSSQAGAIKVSEEHRLLAEALLWLSRFPTIPTTFLQGSLANQLYPPPTMVAQINGDKNASEFWLALGIPPRPAFHLTVTIAMDLLLESTGPLVTQTGAGSLQAGQTAGDDVRMRIGGNLLMNTPPRPIAGGSATVRAINAAGTTVTVDDATAFRVGDFVATDSPGRAQVTRIQGANLILNVALPEVAEGDTLKIVPFLQAWVALEDAAGKQVQTTVSDAQGRFAFDNIKRGNYVLRARAPGLADIQRPVEVPTQSGEYDLQFP
jgi:hypothetical protein